MGTRRLLLALVARLCWRVFRWCEEVDEAVLDRVLARFLRVERYFLVVLVVGIVSLWGRNKGGLSARRARVPRRRPVASTGARRRRARVERSRPPLSLWWLSSPGLVFRERAGATASFFLGCSLAPLVCKKGRVCIRLNRHGGYYYYDYYVIAPGSGRGPGGHSSPLQVVNVKAALFRRVLGIFHCPAQPSTSIAACTVVSLNRGSRAFGL